jgi:hypothetical protein
MVTMLEQAKQAARASRGDGWRLDEKLSEGEIDLPNNLPIRQGFAQKTICEKAPVAPTTEI